jgi:hypothetical protein
LKLPKTIAKCEALEEPTHANDYQMGCNVTNTNVGIQCKHYEAKALVEGLAFGAYVQMILNVKTKNILHINSMHIHVM